MKKQNKHLVHPPEILPELKHFVYYKLKPNHMMEISLTNRIINETDYNSNCFYYSKEEITSYETFQSFDVCVNMCINLKFYFTNVSCFSYFRMVTIINLKGVEKWAKFCPHEQQVIQKSIHQLMIDISHFYNYDSFFFL